LPLRTAAPVRGLCRSLRDLGHPVDPQEHLSRDMMGQKDLFPDLVLEEEKTGQPAGWPNVSDAEIGKNPEMLLPERAELWWDDGTAVPEWFVDRTWPVTNTAAVVQLLCALTGILSITGVLAYSMGELSKAAPKHKHMPFDLSREYGVANEYPTHENVHVGKWNRNDIEKWRAKGGAQGDAKPQGAHDGIHIFAN